MDFKKGDRYLKRSTKSQSLSWFSALFQCFSYVLLGSAHQCHPLVQPDGPEDDLVETDDAESGAHTEGASNVGLERSEILVDFLFKFIVTGLSSQMGNSSIPVIQMNELLKFIRTNWLASNDMKFDQKSGKAFFFKILHICRP